MILNLHTFPSAISDRRPPGVGRGRGRGREEGSKPKGVGRGLEDGGSRGAGGGRGRGGPGGRAAGNRGMSLTISLFILFGCQTHIYRSKLDLIPEPEM